MAEDRPGRGWHPGALGGYRTEHEGDQHGREHPVHMQPVSTSPILEFSVQRSKIGVVAAILERAGRLAGLPLGQECRPTAELGLAAAGPEVLGISNKAT